MGKDVTPAIWDGGMMVIDYERIDGFNHILEKIGGFVCYSRIDNCPIFEMSEKPKSPIVIDDTMIEFNQMKEVRNES